MQIAVSIPVSARLASVLLAMVQEAGAYALKWARNFSSSVSGAHLRVMRMCVFALFC